MASIAVYICRIMFTFVSTTVAYICKKQFPCFIFICELEKILLSRLFIY